MIINQDMTSVFFMDLVHLHLVRMDADVRVDLPNNAVDSCVDDITDATAYYVKRNLCIMHLLEHSFGIGPEYDVGLIQSRPGHVKRDFMRLK